MFLELEPLSESAVASLAGDRADEVYAATGGNPFYVTELLGSRRLGELPPSVANAVARPCVPARRATHAAWSSSSRSCRAASRTRCSTP